ncbi:MAG: head GIN domain-containing protein [Bacteroidota bacterium]
MKKPKVILMLPAIVLASFILTSCMDCIHGKGEVKTRTLPPETFTGIRLNAEANVYLVSDSSKEIVVEAQDNIADNLEMKVRNGSLRISFKRCIDTQEPVKIYIPVKLIDDLQINGSGNIETKNSILAQTLSLKINGSGNLKLNLSAETIFSEINGSGSIYLKGSAKSHETLINGSGNVEAENMATERTEITVNGSGSCKVFAISKLKVLVRGSGGVEYKGTPDVATTIKGSGSVNKIGN